MQKKHTLSYNFFGCKIYKKNSPYLSFFIAQLPVPSISASCPNHSLRSVWMKREWKRRKKIYFIHFVFCNETPERKCLKIFHTKLLTVSSGYMLGNINTTPVGCLFLPLHSPKLLGLTRRRCFFAWCRRKTKMEEKLQIYLIPRM